MKNMKTLIDLGFTETFDVQGRASIADLFKPNKRCGIYVLHASNREYYAGQAIDVTRRYVQHIKNHDDIIRISFMKVSPKKLDDAEQNVIHTLENKGIPLRNIAYTSIPKGESDFDLVMPVKEQNKWLKNLDIVGDKSTYRIIDKELRRKYKRRFTSFTKEKYATQVIRFLRSYVQHCIPGARRGEVSFWAVSCLPNQYVYARINIYWQEVFTIVVSENELWLSFHLAKSPFENHSTKKLLKLFETYPSLDIDDKHKYKPGGPDQIRMMIHADDFKEFVQDPNILPAIRLFNLRLMKKGASNWGNNHCLDLADKLV